MKTMRRVLSIILPLAMLLFTPMALGEETPTIDAASVIAALDFGDVTFPLVEEPITISIMCAKQALTTNSWSEMTFLEEIQRLTNIHIEWIEVEEGAWVEKVKIMLSSGSSMPDVFMSGYSGLGSSLLYKYALEGMILPLDEYYQDPAIMPNAYRIFAQRPDFKAAATYPDGHMYSIPCVEENLNLSIAGSDIAINAKWLERVNLDMPTTFEEFNEMLYAFRSQDANGNGIVGDEIVLSGSWSEVGGAALFGLFGIVDNKSHIIIEDNKVQFSPILPEYRQCAQWLNQLYKDGILDPEIFTQSNTQMLTKSQSDEGVGVVLGHWAFAGKSFFDTDYAYLPTMQGANGQPQRYARVATIPNMNLTGTFLSADCKYPKEVMKFMDLFLANNKTTLTFRFGAENDYWTEQDGAWFVNAESTVTGEAINDTYATKYSWGPRGTFWILKDFSAGMSPVRAMLQQGLAERLQYGMYTWPNGMMLDEEDNETYIQISTELYDYADHMITQFVFNGVDDSSWQAYVESCQALQCEEMESLLQKRWDAYLNQ